MPEGYYNAGNMVRMVGGDVALCGTYLNARCIADHEVVPGAQRGTLDQLATWTAEADKVLVF